MECMMGVRTLLLAFLLGLLEAVVSGSYHGSLIPGAPRNISRNDTRLQQVVLNAAYLYNNQSNDAFLFKPSDILTAQRQIVKGIKYIVDLQISRTVCRRGHNVNLKSCDLQPEGRLHQAIQCYYEVWLIPWENTTESEVLSCKS